MSHGTRLAINMRMTCPKPLLTLALMIPIIVVAAAADAGPRTGVVGPMAPVRPVMVSGKLTTHEGQPAANRQIHFENRVNGDVFLTTTHGDGAFSFPLPPGSYSLRDERGPIIVGHIRADSDDINVGTVSEPGPIQHLLESEGIAPALIHSPAPVTSNVRPGNRLEPPNQVPVPAPSQ